MPGGFATGGSSWKCVFVRTFLCWRLCSGDNVTRKKRADARMRGRPVGCNHHVHLLMLASSILQPMCKVLALQFTNADVVYVNGCESHAVTLCF